MQLNRLATPLLTLLIVVVAYACPAADYPHEQYQNFIHSYAAQLRSKDQPPRSQSGWQRERSRLRKRLLEAWGGFPAQPCPLTPRKLGELKRDGYRVEKIVFQTRPDIWMTANAYVPDTPGRHPAVLCVHGHWRGAKQDPVVQRRCLGLVKLGFFVLAVDAFGAGERGIGKALGEYHGEMVGATLLPVGLPLSGLQVYENMRAVDYLQTRPEVDPERIGITGASGGGNQSMYAGAWDERFRAVVPVCSVGTYRSYLEVACCMCEVVPGALGFTEEWGILGLVAPRGLMVINATQDGIQFSVAESTKSLALTLPIFNFFGKPDHLKHAIFESPHDYNGAMREAMYGWMTRLLKGQGDGSPIREPEIKTEDPETLRCYPGDTRPDDFMTIPKFAAREGGALQEKRRSQMARDPRGELQRMRRRLVRVLGGFPQRTPPRYSNEVGVGRDVGFFFPPEAGLTLLSTGKMIPERRGWSSKAPLAVRLTTEGADSRTAWEGPVHGSGWSVLTLELRGTGQTGVPRDRIGRAPDHNSGEWALWVGRPLLGQWVWDARRLLDTMETIWWSHHSERFPRQITLIGEGPAGVVALCAAALDQRVTQAVAVGSLASYVTDTPYEKQRLGIMAPGILREVGDISELAALVAPRRVIIAGGVAGDGRELTLPELEHEYRSARKVFEGVNASRKLKILSGADPVEIVRAIVTATP